MENVLHVLGIALLLSACGAALFTLILGLPGTMLIVGFALLYGWATDFTVIQWSTIGWLALLAVIAEVAPIARTSTLISVPCSGAICIIAIGPSVAVSVASSARIGSALWPCATR